VPGLANKSDTSHTHPGGGSPDATTTVKGILKLAGDLAGTADLPTVPELANKQPLDSDLTAIAALAPADGTFIKRITGAWNASTLVKGDVGLGSVDNTTDAAKPVSTATQTALNAKAPTNLASVQAYIATAQTTTSLTYVDLTTVGPACVLVLASARRVLIFLKAILFQTSTANRVFMSVAASGATVAAAGDAAAVIHNGSGQAESYAGIVYLDCLAGTTTFTAKYRVAGTTGSFQDRFMVVIPV